MPAAMAHTSRHAIPPLLGRRHGVATQRERQMAAPIATRHECELLDRVKPPPLAPCEVLPTRNRGVQMQPRASCRVGIDLGNLRHFHAVDLAGQTLETCAMAEPPPRIEQLQGGGAPLEGLLLWPSASSSASSSSSYGLQLQCQLQLRLQLQCQHQRQLLLRRGKATGGSRGSMRVRPLATRRDAVEIGLKRWRINGHPGSRVRAVHLNCRWASANSAARLLPGSPRISVSRLAPGGRGQAA